MSVTDKMSAYAPGVLLATLRKLGMELSTRHFVGYMAAKVAGVLLDRESLDNVVALQPKVFDLFAESPSLLDKLAATGALTPTEPSEALAKLLEPYRKTAGLGDMMYRHLIPEGIRPEEQPTTDMLSYTDPANGRTYRTTRGAALQAQDWETRNHLMNQIGGAAMLGGAYKLMGHHPLLGLGLGALGAHQVVSQPQNDLHTNEGIVIPDTTEFAPTQRTAALVLSLVRDAETVPATAFAKFAAIESLVPYAKKGHVEDVVTGLDLDLDSVAIAIGQLIFS
jgi:hypothetical protein